MKKIILIIMMLYSISSVAQIGAIFTSKDSEGNKLSYEITSVNTVMLCWSNKDKAKSTTINVPEVVYYKNGECG